MTADDDIAVSDKHLRHAMYIAFGGKCFYTGRHVPFEEMHIDHVKPLCKGGRNCIANYVLSCQDINLLKNGRHSDQFEKVVTEVISLLFADKVLSVMNDIGLNIDGFIKINDWLRDQNIKENSLLWNRIRNNVAKSSIQRIDRIQTGKNRGITLYRRDDLEAIMTKTLQRMEKGHPATANGGRVSRSGLSPKRNGR
jgi:hypothetical protein